MVTYYSLGGYGIETQLVPKSIEYAPAIFHQMNVNGLHPLDAAKLLLEQKMMNYYVCFTTRTTADEFTKWFNIQRSTLPEKLNGENEIYNELYTKTLKLVNSEPYDFKGWYANDLFSIFSQPAVSQNLELNRLAPCTMNETFLTIWCAMFLKWYNQEQHPEGCVLDTALYVPNILQVSEYDPQLPQEKHPRRIVCKLNPVGMKKFCFTMCNADTNKTLHDLIFSYDLSSLTIDSIMALYANFSIVHEKYDIANVGCTVADICYDLVVGSSYVTAKGDSGFTPNSISRADFHLFMDALRSAIQDGRITFSTETQELFGELLKHIGEKPEIINYFMKPITQVTASEASAFRKSEYAHFITDRFIFGQEAADEDADADTSDEEDTTTDEADTTDTDTPETGLAEGDELGDTTTDALGEDESEQSAEKKDKPQIDPNQMLLELAQPNETISDYLFREMVARRIGYIIKNPPQNAMPNDILMLKRWRSRWLYLTSISCLRDFLTRVSIRLSD